MQARKRFGQHFLHDLGIIDRIVRAIAPQPGQRILEVGPGRGALTWKLLERTATLEVIEIDRDLARALQNDARAAALTVLVQDVLKVDLQQLRGAGPALRIVGNLPYNISTPLLFHLLGQQAAIADMHFMLQKEVVDRMAAAPGTKDYGRLTVMLAVSAQVEKLFEVGPGAFTPPPKVRSAVVRVVPAREPRFATGSPAALRQLVTAAFSQRRKTLRNGLKSLLSVQDIESCGVDPQSRPETLTPEQFGLLALRFSQLYSI